MARPSQPPAHYFDARKVRVRAPWARWRRRFDRVFDEMKKIKGFPLAMTVLD